MRAFLSLPIPFGQAQALEKLTLRLPAGRAVDAEQMHITTLFLGTPSSEMIEDLHEALDGPRFALPQLELNGLGHFGHENPRLVYARVTPEAPLAALHKRLSSKAHATGFKIERRTYVPHVTLARYSRGAIGAGELATVFGAIGQLVFAPFQPIEMQFMLSHDTKRGPQYEVLASYPVLPP